jgi:hypothetical protein
VQEEEHIPEHHDPGRAVEAIYQVLRQREGHRERALRITRHKDPSQVYAETVSGDGTSRECCDAPGFSSALAYVIHPSARMTSASTCFSVPSSCRRSRESRPASGVIELSSRRAMLDPCPPVSIDSPTVSRRGDVHLQRMRYETHASSTSMRTAGRECAAGYTSSLSQHRFILVANDAGRQVLGAHCCAVVRARLAMGPARSGLELSAMFILTPARADGLACSNWAS